MKMVETEGRETMWEQWDASLFAEYTEVYRMLLKFVITHGIVACSLFTNEMVKPASSASKNLLAEPHCLSKWNRLCSQIIWNYIV